MRCLVVLLVSLFVVSVLSAQTWETDKAKLDGSGCLTYEVDANLNRIPDFSHAGYKGGGVAIPEVATAVTISPVAGDNTSHIQAAIDAVSALPLGADGFRGVVYLTAGQYDVNGQLYLHTSGVVLRGVGDGRTGGAETLIYGRGNVPNQRDLITLGGGTNTQWSGQVAGTQQDITTPFVQVGSYSFEVADATNYSVGDNIIINHPCTAAWLAAVDGGGTGADPDWSVGAYPIIFNRFITAISGNEITIDAPVYNHLDASLSTSFIYTYDRAGLVNNVGIEGVRIAIESLGGTDENHIWNAIQLTQVEDAWVRDATISGFGLSGVRTATANHVSVVNVHSIDPVAQVTGGRMYNFNSYVCSNNILFDNCLASNGRHHYVSNGVGSVSGFVVLRSKSVNPNAASEGHRHWSTGMLFDNLEDVGTYPPGEYVMAFYNRGDYGSGHGWSAAHSVLWNCSVDRPGKDATIVVEAPPTAQNYAIGCKGSVGVAGPFNQTIGYVEGSNLTSTLSPASLYEAQLMCRTNTVLADFEVQDTTLAVGQAVVFAPLVQGAVNSYSWDFGDGASIATSSTAGPHTVSYSSTGLKTISLTVSNGVDNHTETKTAYISVAANHLSAVQDYSALMVDESSVTNVLTNDSYLPFADNYAYAFDGIDDKIVHEATLFDEYPFSFSFWMNTTSTSDAVLLYNGNGNSGVTGNSLSLRGGNMVLEAWIYSGGSIKENITSTTSVNDGNWHHIAGVFASPSERHLYVDGVLEGSDNAVLDNVTVQDLNTFSIGNREDSSPNDWYEGLVDDVRVFEGVLDQSDIIAVMGSDACLDAASVLKWSFDDQSTTIAEDEFNYFDGVINGGSSVVNNDIDNGLKVAVIKNLKHGNYVFSDDFEITYTPDAGFMGLDSLSYRLSYDNCDTSVAKVFFDVTSQVLPLDFVSYHVASVDAGNEVTFVTANEVALMGIKLWGSFNGEDYSLLTTFNPANTGGGGVYEYVDKTLLNYYKVEAVNSNLPSNWSAVFTAENSWSDLSVAPNPTNGPIFIKGSRLSKVNELFIYDYAGSEVYSSDDVELATSVLDVSFLVPGIYQLIFSGDEGVLGYYRFVKY